LLYTSERPSIDALSNVIEFRPFLNTDPPAVVSIWNSQPPIRGRVNEVSMHQLEDSVFSIPYFVHEDFICATDDGALVGFVHVADVPSNHNGQPTNDGVIAQLLVNPDRSDSAELTNALLGKAEDRLAEKGRRRVYIGSRFPDCPFYLGLYGGSCIPGVFQAEKRYTAALKQAEYQGTEDILVLQRNLFTSKPTVNRQVLTLRRNYQLLTRVDAPVESWWLACSFGKCERTEFQIVPKIGGAPVGAIEYLNLEAFARQWNARSFGMNYIEIDSNSRRSGLASFLIEESLRSLHQQGVELVEGQISAKNKVIIELLKKCGFTRIERATQFAKSLA
jgi:ribosomal protein S18 acetylase RimI-like enzyme